MTTLFFDKRDKDYYRVQIRDHMFDVFKHKSKKSKLTIPTTVSIINGKIQSWYFNSKKEPGNPILMRNSDKLSNFEILKYFADLRGVDDKQPTLDQTIKKFQFNTHFHDLCAFVRFNNGEKVMVTGNELAVLLTERISSIKSIQSIVETQLKHGAIANLLLCEYRCDKDDTPPNYDYQVKVTLANHQDLYKENEDLFTSKNPKRINIEYIYKIHMDNVESSSRGTFFSGMYGDETNVDGKYKTEMTKGYINATNKISYYKSMDTRANSEACKIVKELASYIENTHKIRVRKLVCGFITDCSQKSNLIGIKELLFDFLETGIYNVDSIASSFKRGYEIDFNELVAAIQLCETGRKPRENPALLEHYLKVSELKQQIVGQQCVKDLMKEEGNQSDYRKGSLNRSLSSNTKPSTVKAPRKSFSNLLMAKVNCEQCQGDFCEFYTITNSQAFLDDFRDAKIDEELQKQREEVNTYRDMLKKPFTISNSLRLKCRDHLKETLKLMKEHQIVPRINNTFINADQDNENQLIAFIKTKTIRKDVENLENMYKTIRVCKLCYTVYRLMSEYFERVDERIEKTSSLTSLPRLSQIQTLRRSDTATLGDHSLKNTTRETPVLETISKFKGEETDEDIINTRKTTMNTFVSKKSILKKSRYNEKGEHMSLSSAREIVRDEVYNSKGMQSARESRTNSAMRASVTKNKIPEVMATKQKRSNSTLTNTRLLHGLLHRVSQPEIQETERKIMIERVFTKQQGNRDGRYVHNLLEHIDDHKLKEKSTLETEYHERGIRKSSKAFREVLTEAVDEIAALNRQNKAGGENLYRSNPIKIVPPNGGEIRRRIAEKVAEFKKKQEAPLNKDLGIIYHKSTQRLSNIADYRLSLPWSQTLFGNLYSYEAKTISFTKYCEIRNISVPAVSQVSKIEQLILDPKTAIPFLILSSPENEDPETVGSNVLVIAHDMFHSFFEDITMYEDIVRGLTNTKIVLFNYPGQGFTSYDSAHLQTNEEIAKILDILLNFLYEEERISLEERLFLVGVGYGGNIISYFLCCNLGVHTNIEAALIINSFIRVDEEIERMGKEWIETLQSLPNDMPEIHFNHYYVMALNQESAQAMRTGNLLQDRIEKNPIKVDGKVFILKGLVEGLDLSELFKRVDLNIYVVHSLNNCIFRSTNAELFMAKNLKEDQAGAKKKQEMKAMRKLVYYEGGHDIATESPESLKKIIVDFIVNNKKSGVVYRPATTKQTEEF